MVTLNIVEEVKGEYPYLRYIPAWENFRWSNECTDFHDIDSALTRYHCTWTGGHTVVFESERDLLCFLLKWS